MSELDNFDNYLVSPRIRTVEKRLFQVNLMVTQNCVLNFSGSMFHISFERLPLHTQTGVPFRQFSLLAFSHPYSWNLVQLILNIFSERNIQNIVLQYMLLIFYQLAWAFSVAFYSYMLTVCFVLAYHLYGWPTEILILKQKKKS